ncbi:MAG: ATP-dependent carboxylate-amine ligase, partial [Asticcacaulis sp.]|nr:ATP-dependent carboxylate-amine ligase [Asticcacaulis sp.]
AMTLFGWPEALATGRLRQWQRDRGLARDGLAGAGMEAMIDSFVHGARATIRGKSLSQVLTEDIEYNGPHHAG